jgi:transcriptional regulator
MKRWLIRQIVVPWLRERGLVLPSDKRKEIAERLHVDEQVVAAMEQLIRNAIIESLSKE